MRWHWWRFSAKAFVWGMIASALVVISQKILFPGWDIALSLSATIGACFVLTVFCGFIFRPTDIEVLVDFYKSIRPFGIWGPIRKEAIKRELPGCTERDPECRFSIFFSSSPLLFIPAPMAEYVYLAGCRVDNVGYPVLYLVQEFAG
jgi:hypothetical protein